MKVCWVFLVYYGRALMHKPKSNIPIWINAQERTPERFWFTEIQAAFYRESMINNSSEGMFLYQHDDILDKTGKESWWALYNALANDEEYWMSAIESSILAQMWSVFKDFLTYTHHIEAGAAAWKANKWKNDIYPHFWKYKSYGRPFYIDVDTSWSLLQSVLQEFNETGIPAFWLQCDWRSLAVMDKYDDKVFYLLWWSIGNFSDDQVIEILRNFRSDSIFKWCNIILTQFLRPEEPNKKQKIEELLAQYSCHEVKEWIMKWMQAIGIDTIKCRFCVEYEENNTKADRIKVGVECLETMEVDIGWGKNVTKKPWEKLRAISSKRWSKNQFSALVEKAWCTMEETFTDDQKRMAVHVLKTPPKRMSMATKITAAIAWSLVLLFGGLQTWKMIERADRHKKQDKLKQEIVTWLQWQLSLRDLQEETKKMLFVIQYRYQNKSLSFWQINMLEWLIEDYIVQHPLQYTAKYWWWGMEVSHYSDLYYPTEYDDFMMQNKQVLERNGINTIPHSDILQHHDALRNTYFYVWETITFSEKDVDYIGEYRSTEVGVWNDGKIDWTSLMLGKVLYQWKEYVVSKFTKETQYRLNEKSNSLWSQWMLCTGDVVATIIARGEVPVLTKKIRDLLVEHWWDWYTAVLNWQPAIAKVLLDLYAEWGDLSFLLSSGSFSNSIDDTPLRQFIVGYLVPKIWIENISGQLSADIRIDNLSFVCERYSLFLQNHDEICLFLKRYLRAEDALWSWKITTIIIKAMIWDSHILKRNFCDPQIVRAWIIQHAATFRENGIMVPVFPE